MVELFGVEKFYISCYQIQIHDLSPGYFLTLIQFSLH